MLMGTHDSPIDVVDMPIEVPLGIGLLLDGGQKLVPDPCFAPAVKPAGDGAPGAIPLWQITPRGASPEQPSDAVQNATMVSGWTAGFRFLRR